MHAISKNCVIKVKITPRANKNAVFGVMEDGTIKIKISAPPVDGKANSALIDFIAKTLDVSEENVLLMAGQTSHLKLLKIFGLTNNEVLERLNRIIS